MDAFSGSPNRWLALEEAVHDLGADLAPAGSAERRHLVVDGISVPIDVSVRSATGGWHLRMPLEDWAAEGPGWATKALAVQDGLLLGRVAAAAGRVQLLWELDEISGAVRDGESLIRHSLRLIVEDAAFALAQSPDSESAGDLGAPNRSATSAGSASSAGCQSVGAASAVDAWCREGAAPNWKVSRRQGSWRLVRAVGAASGLPAVCVISERQELLEVSTSVWLLEDLSPGQVEGIAAHLLQQNARLAVTHGLRPSSANGQWNVVIRRATPLAGLTNTTVGDAVKAVVASYQANHLEIEVLCNPEVAHWAARCADYRSTRKAGADI